MTFLRPIAVGSVGYGVETDEAIGAVLGALADIGNGRYRQALNKLAPLVSIEYPAAILAAATFSLPEENEQAFDQRHLNLVQKAASLGFAPAVFLLGCYYDTGDLVERDGLRAAKLFAEAAFKGHAQSQWIHALDLLYGKHGFHKNVEQGLALLQKSANVKFEGAMRTLAAFHRRGEFGVEKSDDIALEIERHLKDEDVITI